MKEIPTHMLSVVVCSYNGVARLQRFLPSLDAARRLAECATELLVLDDGSTDDTSSIAHEMAPTARVIRLPTNKGLPAARNAAVAAARGDWVLFCDDDVSISASAISGLWNLRQERQCLVPAVRGPAGEIQNSVTLEWHLGDPKFRFHSSPMSSDLAFAVGSCFLIHRNDYCRAGGSSEWVYPMYYDDVALGARLARTGTTITMAGHIEVVHFQHGADSSPSRLAAIEDAVYQNRWVYVITELRGARRSLAMCLGLPRVLRESIRKRSIRPLYGYARAVRCLPELVTRRSSPVTGLFRAGDAQP